jgi:hypothetical protein
VSGLGVAKPLLESVLDALGLLVGEVGFGIDADPGNIDDVLESV